MDFVKDLLVVLHLLGMAAIFGAWLVVRAEPRMVPTIVWGARAQIITGLLLTGLAEMGDDPVNHAKIGVKLVLGLTIAGIAERTLGKQKRGSGSVAGPVNLVGALSAVAVAVAVLWAGTH